MHTDVASFSGRAAAVQLEDSVTGLITPVGSSGAPYTLGMICANRLPTSFATGQRYLVQGGRLAILGYSCTVHRCWHGSSGLAPHWVGAPSVACYMHADSTQNPAEGAAASSDHPFLIIVPTNCFVPVTIPLPGGTTSICGFTRSYFPETEAVGGAMGDISGALTANRFVPTLMVSVSLLLGTLP